VRGGLEALICRAVFYELAELVQTPPGAARPAVRSHGTWFPLEAAG
jgi:hypothetical protein